MAKFGTVQQIFRDGQYNAIKLQDGRTIRSKWTGVKNIKKFDKVSWITWGDWDDNEWFSEIKVLETKKPQPKKEDTMAGLEAIEKYKELKAELKATKEELLVSQIAAVDHKEILDDLTKQYNDSLDYQAKMYNDQLKDKVNQFNDKINTANEDNRVLKIDYNDAMAKLKVAGDVDSKLKTANEKERMVQAEITKKIGEIQKVTSNKIRQADLAVIAAKSEKEKALNWTIWMAMATIIASVFAIAAWQ